MGNFKTETPPVPLPLTDLLSVRVAPHLARLKAPPVKGVDIPCECGSSENLYQEIEWTRAMIHRVENKKKQL